MPKTQIEMSKKSSVPGPIIPENDEKQQKNTENQRLLTATRILPADQDGELFFISGVAFPNRESALKRVEKFQKEQKNCFMSGAAYSRKEEKIQFATRLTGFSLNFNSKTLFDSSQALLCFLPEGVVCPDDKGCVYISWLFDREYKVEDTDALFSELKEILSGRATVTPRIPWNSYSRKEKFPGEVTLKDFENGVNKALDKLLGAKGLKKPARATKSPIQARNDSGDASMAVEEIEAYEERYATDEEMDVFTEVVECEQGIEVGMETEQEIMGGNKCSFASAKSLNEVKVSLSIYSGYYESEPLEQKLGISVEQALDFVLQQGQPKVTSDKLKAPYWAGEMKSAAWTGETKKKKDAARQTGFNVPEEGIQRSGSHCVGATLVKLDLDDITAGDFEAVKSKIQASGLEVVIYTTHSYGAEGKGNRYRVVFVLDRQASVAEFEAVSVYVGKEMLGRTYDATEHKAYQLAGVWAVHPDRRASAQHWRYTGAAVSVDKVLALAGGAGCQEELVSPIGVGSGTCELTKSLMNSNLESKDPLPVWDDACYQTLKDALTHPKIHENHSPDQNPTQVKVLAALLKSVEVTQQKYPDQEVVAGERCKSLYVAYASGNRRGFDLAQIEKDWDSQAIGGMDKISPFYIVGIANQLRISTAHITNGGALGAARIHEAVAAGDDASELLPANGEKVTATLYGMTFVLFKKTREVGLRLAFDEFSGTEVISDWNQNSWRSFADADYVDIRLRLERLFFKKVSQELVKDAVAYVTSKIRIDTAKIWAESLPAWDGVTRVDAFFDNYFGCENSEYHTEVARFIWTALAGRVFVPGLKVDMAPILCGEQGLRKSTAVSALSPCEDYFSELDFGTSEKERKRTIKGKLVIELAELSGMKKTDKEALKRFLVATFDEYVPHYKEKPVRYPRRCLFIGTTNHDDFLNDETGNRRYLPIRVSQISVDELKRDRNQLWAEGIALFKQWGVLYAKAEKLAVLEHPDFEGDDAIGEAVEKAITSVKVYDGKGEASALKDREYIKLDDVLVVMGIDNAQKQRLQGAVVKGLKKLGYVSRQKRILAGENPSRVWILDKKAA